jgi:malate/lactate dehydrogenase
MLLNEYIIRCSKIDYRNLNLAGRPIELHIDEEDTDEIIEELKRRGIEIYNQKI